jgi:hypothetical protein
MEIPYFRMDSLAFMSSDIVLCDEVSYVKKARIRRAWPAGAEEEYWEGTFTVVSALKGPRKAKEKLVVEIDLVYTRRFKESYFQMADDPPLPAIALGRALLFLTNRAGTWQANGIKLIIDGEAYTYGQFMSNPGPLWLARMAPENFYVLPITTYGEELLLEDLQIAQEKAKSLTAPIPIPAGEGVIRPEYPAELRVFAVVAAGAILAILAIMAYRRRRRHFNKTRLIFEQTAE